MVCRTCLQKTTGTLRSHRQGSIILAHNYHTTTTTPSNCPSAPTAGPSRHRLATRPEPRRSPGARSFTSHARTTFYPSPLERTSSLRFAYRRHAATLAKSERDLTPARSLPVPLDVTPPSLQAIHDEGYLDEDVQLVNEDEAFIVISPDAINQLVKITSKEPAEILSKGQLALRVGVESGGCHGYQYTMEIVEERGVDDYVMQPIGYNSIPVVIDLVSLGLLKGATLHHATELIGSSFRIQANPQAKEGGDCGCGISWELK